MTLLSTSRRVAVGLAAVLIFSTVTGAAYIWSLLEANQGSREDVVFVILLWTATLFLGGACFYVTSRIEGLLATVLREADVPPRESPVLSRGTVFQRLVLGWRREPGSASALVSVMFDPVLTRMAGVSYGVAVAAAPWVLPGHEGSPVQRLLLSAFLFFCNYLTGVAIYSASVLLRHSWSISRKLDVSLFRRHARPVRSYARLLAIIAIIAAFYIGTCQLSVVFSRFSGPGIYAYRGFAVLIYLGVYFIPQVPIAQRLREDKRAVLERIEERIAELYSGKLGEEHAAELQALHSVRGDVAGMCVAISIRGSRIVTGVAVASWLAPHVVAYAWGRLFS